MIAAITGMLAGAVHVWSGPDHVAAIAPLAAHGRGRAWAAGVRWGLGHTSGVAVVGLVALWLRDVLPVDLLSSWGERMVGVMLLGIGLWGMRKACKNRIHAHEHEHDGRQHMHIHIHSRHPHHDRSGAHQHSHAAFGIGILHGFAGSSHLLGVLPMLAFPTRAQAMIYLAAFGIGTVAAMAAFSWLLGLVASRCAASGAYAYRRLMRGCSLAAMVVGCVWLVM